MHQHLSNPAVIEQAQQRAAVTAATPVFLDDHQSKTLEVLAEAIVPGSTGARVGPFIDQLLAVESAANQRAFLGALGAFDMVAINRHGKAWIGITPSQQDALLREASTADAKTSALRGHFQNLKDWIAGAYYSSETGMRELGWTATSSMRSCPGARTPAATRTDRVSERHHADDEIRCDCGGLRRLRRLGGEAAVRGRHQGRAPRSGEAARRRRLHASTCRHTT